jgi:hypothetical protein
LLCFALLCFFGFLLTHGTRKPYTLLSSEVARLWYGTCGLRGVYGEGMFALEDGL